MIRLDEKPSALLSPRVRMVVCPRCRKLRVPRPDKRVCGSCADELEHLWTEVTPLPPAPGGPS